MKKNVTQQLIATRRNIKAKLELIKAARSATSENLEASYRPLAKILSETKNEAPPYKEVKVEKQETFKDEEEEEEDKEAKEYGEEEEGRKEDFIHNISDSSLFGDDHDSSMRSETFVSNLPRLNDYRRRRFLSESSSSGKRKRLAVQVPLTPISNLEKLRKPNFSDEEEEQQQQQPREQISHAAFQEYLSQYNELPRKYIEGWVLDTSKEYDTTYIRHDRTREIFTLGNSKVNIVGDDMEINNQTFKGTPGLYELVFKTSPNQDVISKNDLTNFTEMLLLTNAHKRRFDPNEVRQGTKAQKYLNVIKPLIDIAQQKTQGQNPRGQIISLPNYTGSGSSVYKNLQNKSQTDFIYWDDPNELVDRLRLLYASTSSGNNAHQNEIISIIEELREANIIY
jgi:hypothetical protein